MALFLYSPLVVALGFTYARYQYRTVEIDSRQLTE